MRLKVRIRLGITVVEKPITYGLLEKSNTGYRGSGSGKKVKAIIVYLLQIINLVDCARNTTKQINPSLYKAKL